MGYRVAVVGATGNVGREMLNILAERSFPADEVIALASRRSQGTEVSFGDKTLKVKALEHYDFSDVDICLMSAGSAVSKEWSPKIAAAGAVVIDNSSCWRYDSDVPLIVPEVNADAVAGFRKKGIIANPNCSTAQLVVVLKPLHDKAKITRVVVATCVRVPVFVGHSEAVHIEFENPITADEARELLRNAPGVLVIDKREAGGYATPFEAAGEDATYVSRIREDATVENGLALWCVSDNLRKGAALNAIQIAECLINRKLIEAKRKAA